MVRPGRIQTQGLRFDAQLRCRARHARRIGQAVVVCIVPDITTHGKTAPETEVDGRFHIRRARAARLCRPLQIEDHAVDEAANPPGLRAVVVIVRPGVAKDDSAGQFIAGDRIQPHVELTRLRHEEIVNARGIGRGGQQHRVIRASRHQVRARSHQLQRDRWQQGLAAVLDAVIVRVVPDHVAHRESAPKAEINGHVRVGIAIIRRGFPAHCQHDDRTVAGSPHTARLAAVVVIVFVVIRRVRRAARAEVAGRRGHAHKVASRDQARERIGTRSEGRDWTRDQSVIRRVDGVVSSRPVKPHIRVGQAAFARLLDAVVVEVFPDEVTKAEGGAIGHHEAERTTAWAAIRIRRGDREREGGRAGRRASDRASDRVEQQPCWQRPGRDLIAIRGCAAARNCARRVASADRQST